MGMVVEVREVVTAVVVEMLVTVATMVLVVKEKAEEVVQMVAVAVAGSGICQFVPLFSTSYMHVRKTRRVSDKGSLPFRHTSP